MCRCMDVDPRNMGKSRNMRPIAIIPGPSQPSQLDPYLKAVMAEFFSLGLHGMDVQDTADSQPYKHRPFLSGVLADSPARLKLTKWNGPGAYIACGWCTFQGTSVTSTKTVNKNTGKPSKTVYYKGYAEGVKQDMYPTML